MKMFCALFLSLPAFVSFLAAQSADLTRHGQNDLRLEFRPAVTSIPYAAVSRSVFLEHSEDLAVWETLEEIQLTHASTYRSGLQISTALLGDSQRYFRFRIEQDIRYTTDNAAEYLGLEAPFTAALIERFYAAPDDLLPDYPERTYLGDLPWDVTTAEFWDLYATNPEVNNQGRDPLKDGWRAVDYRLNAAEMEVFQKNGFVVSERLGTSSFGDAFYDLWTDDLPVFISTDALLQAWHYSFQSSLEEIDAFVMATELERLLAVLIDGLESHRALYDAGSPFLREAFIDIDGFLQVAQALQRGVPAAPGFADPDTVNSLVDKALAAQVFGFTEIFGEQRLVDFTQFTPRGHYTKSETLQRYFRAMMWLFRIDFRLTPPIQKQNDAKAKASALRQLASASLLAQLVIDQGQQDRWQRMENVIAAVGGYGDALTPPQWIEVLEAANANTVGSVGSRAIAEDLQSRLLAGTLGLQNIRSRAILSPRHTQQQAVLPRSFTFFSQRFVLDSWAMSKLVFDSIIFDENGIPEETDKVQRRIPSGLDVAFTALGNDTALPILVDRMEDPAGRAYRDGYPYQNNLAAVRSVLDNQPESAWTGNVYHHWLGTLRELSHLPNNTTVPLAMRTQAWARKDLNTQLASWTQLRHDTILYAKQSATALTICWFPDGYVEPRPLFWKRLREMAEAMQGLVATLPAEGEGTLFHEWFGPMFFDLDTWKANMSTFYADFAGCVRRLEALVQKELNHEPFTEADLTFIDGLIQDGGEIGSGGERRYDGWYPNLFYQRSNDEVGNGAAEFDALVTDVHTDFPDVLSGDPGTVLHEAVGGVPFLLIAIEREGGRRAVYGGPVLSHYEFDSGPSLKRWTDEEWQASLLQGSDQRPHDWTSDYLVPAPGGIPVESP